MPTPSVAILLAAFNGRRWLPEQLASIFAQQGVTLHVFVSVDKSSDGTEAWLADYAQKETRLTLLPLGARFGSAAKNFYRLLRDVAVTGFDYVALADQDDIWKSDHLARAELQLKLGHAAYSSDVEAFWPDGRRRILRKSQPQKRWDFLFESAGPGCSFVFNAQLAEAIQVWLKENWDEIQQVKHHDWLIYAFTRAKGYAWFIDSYPGIDYRQHGNNELGARVGISGLGRRANRVWNGGGFPQAILVAKLVGLENNDFVSPWVRGRRFAYLGLALAARQCRRYWLDQIFFALLCLAAWLRGK